MRPFQPAIATTVLVLTALGPAAWSNPPQPKEQLIGKVHVELKDLDLRNPAHAHALLDRLTRAAWRACGGDPKLNNSYRTRPEQTVRAYEECRENAVKRAIDQIGAPLLAQIYDERRQHTVAADPEPRSGNSLPAQTQLSLVGKSQDPE